MYNDEFLSSLTIEHCYTCTVQYSTVQYSTIQYSTVQYSTVQYNTVQYSTVQCSTVQYSTLLTTVSTRSDMRSYALNDQQTMNKLIQCATQV